MTEQNGGFFAAGEKKHRIPAEHKKTAPTIAGAVDWLGWKDLNPRNDGVRVHCLTAWLHPSIFCCYRYLFNRLYYYTTVCLKSQFYIL